MKMLFFEVAVLIGLVTLLSCEQKSTVQIGTKLSRHHQRMEELPEADEMWSSASFPQVHTGHSLGLVERTGIYYYFLSTDIPIEPYENFPKTGTFRWSADDELILDTVFGGSIVLVEIDLDGTRALIPRSYQTDLDAAIESGVVLLKRDFVDLANPFARSEDMEFELIGRGRK